MNPIILPPALSKFEKADLRYPNGLGGKTLNSNLLNTAWKLSWYATSSSISKYISIYIYIYIFRKRYVYTGGSHSVIIIVVENRHSDLSSNPESVYISHSINTFEKGMNPIILPPALSKLKSWPRYPNGLGGGKLWTQTS